jgi:hypothetical protein
VGAVKTLEILKAARAKIEKPECWTQDFYARSASGKKVVARSPAAVCWCSYGALQSVMKAKLLPIEIVLLLERPMHGCIADFNDTHTHAEVLAAFDAAIDLAAKEPTP